MNSALLLQVHWRPARISMVLTALIILCSLSAIPSKAETHMVAAQAPIGPEWHWKGNRSKLVMDYTRYNQPYHEASSNVIERH